MKGILGYILIAAFAMLTCIACNKSLSDKQPKHGLILLNAVEEGATKALLDGNTFMTKGNQIVVYDYYTAPKGVQNPNPATGYYIPGVTAQSTGATDAGTVWPFLDDARYEWTDAGTHKFFGWMVKDNNMTQQNTPETFFGSGFGFNTTNHILTIPTTALSQDSPQFDFMYSNITPREPATEGFDPVGLAFKHLFTAFKITAANNSSNEVYLKKVTITGLKNKRRVTISYVGDAPVITYTYPPDTKASDFVYNVSTEGKKLDKNAANISSPSDDTYTMMWAHSKEDFAEAKILVEYNYKEPDNPLNTNGVTTVEMKDLKWESGSKNVLGLMFKDKEIALTCKVEPWNVVSDEIDFTDQISVSKPIMWEENTVDYVNYDTGEVILYSDDQIEAICNFHIDTPAGATWTASLIPVEGYSDAFMIEGGTKYGAVGVDSQIRIRVTNKAPIAPRHIVLLRITVQTADGRTITADLMPKNEQNEEIKEFKLIQNLING